MLGICIFDGSLICSPSLSVETYLYDVGSIFYWCPLQTLLVYHAMMRIMLIKYSLRDNLVCVVYCGAVSC